MIIPITTDASYDAATWWAASGGAWLTGHRDGPPLTPTADVGAYAIGALAAIDDRSGRSDPESLPRRAADLLFGRAAFTGAQRGGQIATGGTGRIVRAADGWVAINLARPNDLSAVAAIVEGDDGGDPFAAIETFAMGTPAQTLTGRAQMLGVPAAVVGSAPARSSVVTHHGQRSVSRGAPRVVDLTSLWAGPTCARLLTGAGAHVTKVESTTRPDGARRGNRAFYQWLHREAAEATVDFTSAAGRAELVDLLDAADVVLESSRPRALRQLGIVAEHWLAAEPGRVWLSITGYGRTDPEPGRVAFGDDAAAAGGLVAYDPALPDTPLFVGDAIADPLTGITAAQAVLDALGDGGGVLVDVALAGVAAHVVARHPRRERSVVADARSPQLPKPDNSI